MACSARRRQIHSDTNRMSSITSSCSNGQGNRENRNALVVVSGGNRHSTAAASSRTLLPVQFLKPSAAAPTHTHTYRAVAGVVHILVRPRLPPDLVPAGSSRDGDGDGDGDGEWAVS